MGIAYMEEQLQKRMNTNVIQCYTVLRYDIDTDFLRLKRAGVPDEFLNKFKMGDKFWIFRTPGRDYRVYIYTDSLDRLLRKIVEKNYG